MRLCFSFARSIERRRLRWVSTLTATCTRTWRRCLFKLSFLLFIHLHWSRFAINQPTMYPYFRIIHENNPPKEFYEILWQCWFDCRCLKLKMKLKWKRNYSEWSIVSSSRSFCLWFFSAKLLHFTYVFKHNDADKKVSHQLVGDPIINDDQVEAFLMNPTFSSKGGFRIIINGITIYQAWIIINASSSMNVHQWIIIISGSMDHHQRHHNLPDLSLYHPIPKHDFNHAEVRSIGIWMGLATNGNSNASKVSGVCK